MIHALIVGASVAVKWVVNEPGSEDAVDIVAQGHDLVAPRYVLIEVANALRKNVKAGQLDDAAASEAFQELLDSPLELAEVDADLCTAALALALALQHPAQDCLYLALAVQENARVLTDDRKFASAVRRSRELARRIVLLGEPLG